MTSGEKVVLLLRLTFVVEAGFSWAFNFSGGVKGCCCGIGETCIGDATVFSEISTHKKKFMVLLDEGIFEPILVEDHLF